MIIIYGASWCTWCKRAKELAEARDLPYVWKDVEEDGVYDELKAAKPAHASSTIPQIWWNGHYVGGYTDLAQEIENTSGGFGDGKI
jgi:glutaredoxin